MDDIDYKAAYERQKKARVRVESIIEERSRELYEMNLQLTTAYEKLKSQRLQLVHQEKLASVGLLSAGIAHEINNPVGFIKSNLSSLKYYAEKIRHMMNAYQQFAHDVSITSDVFSEKMDALKQVEKEVDINFILEDFDDAVNESIEGTDRISDIITGLKSFSRIDGNEKKDLLVNDCIHNAVKLIQNEIKYKADLEMNLGEVPKTMGYAGGLSQVVVNLMVNASQAIEFFGLIKVTTRYTEVPTLNSTANIETKKNNGSIIIEVEDNGMGMSEDVMDRIFDPFYTTKDVGVGTGLGLSISMGVIKKHGGDITVSSQIGVGTCFTLILPVIPTA